MSALKYINEPGAGQHLSDSYGYSQAVLINNTAKLSGQGGWDNEGNLEQYDWKQQITNAFDNVERVLKAAGFRGWEDVYLVRSYQLDIVSEFGFLDEVLKKRVPGHRPVWTALGVKSLALPAMFIEIEVEAIKSE